jgi:hypothetical protein
MNNIIPFALTGPQQGLYDGLIFHQQDEINQHIGDINNTMPITLQDIQNEWRLRNRNQNIPNDLNDAVVNQAKAAMRNEDTQAITAILAGNPPVPLRNRGPPLGALLQRVELIRAQARAAAAAAAAPVGGPVGGKLRKTSNKKVFIRRRSRSSKRKVRKVRKVRTTRRR